MSVIKRKMHISREAMLRSRPARNELLKWEKNSRGEVVITISRQTGWKVRVLTAFFHIPKQRTITLDEVGSEVWMMCDGKNTVDRMIRSLSQTHKLNRKEAEVSLLTYLRTLGKKRMVGFVVDREEIGSAAKRVKR